MQHFVGLDVSQEATHLCVIGPDGKVIGKHEPTGQIPVFVSKLRKRGIKIDMGMFAPEGGAAPS